MVNKIKVALFGFGKTGKIVAQSLYDDDQFDLVFVIKKNINKVKLKNLTFSSNLQINSINFFINSNLMLFLISHLQKQFYRI